MVELIHAHMRGKAAVDVVLATPDDIDRYGDFIRRWASGKSYMGRKRYLPSDPREWMK